MAVHRPQLSHRPLVQPEPLANLPTMACILKVSWRDLHLLPLPRAAVHRWQPPASGPGFCPGAVWAAKPSVSFVYRRSVTRTCTLRAAPKWYPLGAYMQTGINTPKGSQNVGSAHRCLNVGMPMISAFYTAGQAQTRVLPCAGRALKSHTSHWFLGSCLGRPINCCSLSTAQRPKNMPFSLLLATFLCV
jgi:hypothetical protein